ncbi:MFS transporter [Novosphingobium sp.]|uniref:MFS transporter n=1 Tax=Novosphingobium sp. TaxID=1874826 RepID=UPI003B52C282
MSALPPSAKSAAITAKIPLALCLGIAASMGAAHLGINYTPYLVGGLIDKFGFRPGAMGVFATAETLSFAIAMFVFAPRAQALRPRHMALIASAMIAVVQIGSSMTGILPLLVLGRVATGFGYGMLNTAVNVAAARTGQPARAISVGISLQVLLFMVMNLTIPQIGAWGGVGAMFIALGMISGTLALGMLTLTNTTEHGVGSAHEPVPPIAPGGWPVLAAMALFAFGTMAIWPFMERAAHAIGLPATTFGRYQSMANLLSSAGNFALTMLLARGMRRGYLEVALLVCGGACALLTTVNNEIVFAVALQLYNVSWYIVYTLLLGLAYTHDPHGRLAVRTTGTWLVAQSAGSLAAGFVAQATKGYGVVGCLGMITCAIAVAIVIRFQAGKRVQDMPLPVPAH